MSLVSLSIPNFVSGVSQQPPALKTTTATDSMDNCWPSVVSGISKRPPSEFVAEVGASTSNSVIGSIINRTGVAQFIITITDGNLRVFDLLGTEKTVNFPEGKAYLSNVSDPVSAFRFVNIQDTTFILNKEYGVKENAYGEMTGAAFVADEQVYDYASLPDPSSAPLDIVYRLSSTGQLYKLRTHIATSDLFGWTLTASGWTSAGGDGGVSGSLPAATAAGTVWYVSYGVTNWVTVWTQYGPTLIPVGGTEYRRYVSYQYGWASAGYNYWELITPDQAAIEYNRGRLDPTNMATVFVTNSAANTYYNVYINGALAGSYLSPTGTDAASSVPGSSTIAAYLAGSLNGNGWTTVTNGSTITITNFPNGGKIKGTASQGDKLVKTWYNKVPTFADLPPNSPEGRIVKIAGDMQNAQDDYYVVYHEGRWEETYGWQGGSGLIRASMPWVLTRNRDDTFSFTSWIWRNRAVGDANSNKAPTFCNNVINDMFLFSNRLCFITDTDLVMSETFRYENFFRTTIATLQDSDPMYLTVSTKNDDTLRHVIPFNKELLIMGDKSQYRFSYQQFVGPKNVQIQYTTAFNVSRKVMPANMGMSAYFVDDAATYRYGKVFEYFPRPNQQGDDATEVTEPVPNYIPSGVTFLSASPRMQMLTVGTTGEPGTLFVYKFFWAGDNKVQNCWNRWTFTDCDRVYWAGFMDNYLYVILKRGSKMVIERIRADEEAVMASPVSRVMLDRFLVFNAGSPSVTYNSSLGKTVIVFPYTFGATLPQVVYTKDTESAVQLEVTNNALGPAQYDRVYIDGDFRGYDLLTGIPYTMSFQLSKPYYRKQGQGGQIAVLDGRLDIRHLHLVYSKSAYFKVLLKRKGFVDQTMEWSSLLVDNVGTTLGITQITDGQKRIPVMCNNLSLDLYIQNDSPYQCILQSGEWWATYHPRTRPL